MTVEEFDKDYEIASVSRRDLQIQGVPDHQIESLSDADMLHIAQEMAHLYIDRAFWEDLTFVVRTVLAEKRNNHAKNT